MYVYMYICMYICMCMYVYIYVCICICICIYSKAKLKNELTPSRKKTQFLSYYIIFLLSSKLSDLHP